MVGLGGGASGLPGDFNARIQELVRSSFDQRISGVELDWIQSAGGKAQVLKVGVERSDEKPRD
jgi:hypothetical protein